MDVSFSSAVVVLLLVMDPIGNVPLFVALLRDVDPSRRLRVIMRECAIAFAVLVAFVFAGGPILRLLGLSQSSLSIAGGVILFLIAPPKPPTEKGTELMDFPLDEYKTRLARVRAEMVRHDLPVLLLHQPESHLYLTGFRTTGYFAYLALIVPATGDPVLVIRDMEVPAARGTSYITHWATYADSKDPVPAWFDAVRRALDGLGLSGARIGIDCHSWFLTVERFEALKAALPHATLVAEPKIVDRLRLIKSPAETKYMTAAARAVDAGMKAGIEAVRPGVSERDLARAVFDAMIAAGSEQPLSGCILTGDRNDQLHGGYTDRKLAAGEQAYFELSGIVCNYYARLMRTAIAGRPSTEQRRIAETIIGIQNEGIRRMNPGVTGGEVDRYFREKLLASGLRDTYTNRSGYSLGLIYRPSAGEFLLDVVPEADWTLAPGMVFHMLMMARGMGFSETVVITESGAERLTSLERKLFASE